MAVILDILTKTTVFILMLVVGTDCTWSGLRTALRRPGLVNTVVLGQFVLVPAVMYGCCRLMGLPVAVTGSLLLISCCLTGSISNTHCFLAKGNTTLSVTVTALSCLVAIAATPLSLRLVRGILGAGNSGIPLIPVGPLVNELAFMMILPLIIGGVLRYFRPDWVRDHQRVFRIGTLVTVAVFITLIIGIGPGEVVRRLREIMAVTVLFAAVLLAAAWLLSRAFHLSRDDLRVALFEWPCRNLAIAMVVGVNVLGRPDLVRFAAALFVVQAVIIPGLIYTLDRTIRTGSGTCV